MKLAQLLSNSKPVKWGTHILAAALAGGCETKSFFDPSEMGRYKKDPLLLPILPSLDTGVEETNVSFLNAGDVRAEDLVASSKDYAIGPSDLINVSITDVVSVGVETLKTVRVSDSGTISLPLIGQINIGGLTEGEAEQKIIQAYKSGNYVQNAQVSVTVAEARARTFSILGAVGAAGEYQMFRSDFRLLDALVLSRDVLQPAPEELYIIRHTGGGESSSQPAAGTPATRSAGDLLAPRTDASSEMTKRIALLQTSGAPATNVVVPPAPSLDTPIDQTRVTSVSGAAATMQPAGSTANTTGFEFNDVAHGTDTRVIRIPIQPLLNGDLKYNVVIKARDQIIVPTAVTGEYYMGGHVARAGVYSLTGRKITLKQAVISAGMLDQVAIPGRTEVIRRVGPDREVFARVDLDKIFSGELSDIYLKPNDQIMVGTNAFAPFLAAGRSAFRITYGFGFLYDRNYAGN